MILHLNNLEHAIHIDRLHYNYLAEEQNAAIQLSVQLGEYTNQDVQFLGTLVHEHITRLTIKEEDQIIYDLEDDLRIVTLMDNVENGNRYISVELARIEE